MVRRAFRTCVGASVLVVGVVVACNLACGLYGEETTDAPTSTTGEDGGTDALVETSSSTGDGATNVESGAPSCHGSFGEPRDVAGLENDRPDYSARFSQDELTVYVTRPDVNVVGLSQTFIATRTSKTSPFTNLTKVAELGAVTESIGLSTLPADELSVFFTVRAQSDASPILHRSARTSTKQLFGPRAQFPLPFKDDGEARAPYVTPNGEALWLDFIKTTTSPEGPIRNIVRATLTTRTLRVHDELGNDANSAVVTPDEREIFFSRPSGIYHATRATTADVFGPASFVREGLGSGLPSWISPDGCRLYVCLDREKTLNYDIVVLTRAP